MMPSMTMRCAADGLIGSTKMPIAASSTSEIKKPSRRLRIRKMTTTTSRAVTTITRRNVAAAKSVMQSLKRFISVTVILSSLVISFTSCRRRASSEAETPDTSTYRPESTPATQFERDLKYVRDAHFTYVWIFSRQDGKELTKTG